MSDISTDVRSLGYQCPMCGVPVDVARAADHATLTVTLAPCGHDVGLNDL